MKIAIVSEHASPLAVIGGVDAGGQNVHVAALASALAARGHQITVFTRRDSVALPDRLTAPGGYVVEHVTAGPPHQLPKDELLPFMPTFAERLADRFAAEPVDVVHSHFWMSGLAARLAAQTTQIPVVATFHALGAVKRRHQGHADTSPPERCAIEAELAAGVDHIIATCTDEVRELVRLGADRHRISVVPCGVDLDLFLARPVPARRQLLVAGRLVARKGVDDVIRALRELPGTELVVAGGPAKPEFDGDPEVRRLRAVATELGVNDRVRFLGPVPREHMPAVLRSARAVVAVPWYEPFGIVPLEAMACGRPVVASAVGGMLDTVAPGRTGLLVPPRAPAELAAALRYLLADRRRCQHFGRAGSIAARRYAWPRVAADTETAYQRALRPAVTL